MKKKQIISLAVMFGVIILLAAGYIFASRYNDKKDEEAAKESEVQVLNIYDIAADDITKISITNSKGNLNIVLKDGTWVQEETEIPMDEEKVQSMLDAVADIDAIKVISDDGNNMAEYGLDNPQINYTITLTDGTEYNIRLGIALQTDVSAHYALLDSDSKVYSVSDNYYTPFDVDLASMTAIEDDININADYITKLKVTDKDGLDFESEYIGEGTSDEYYKWEITRPYKDVLADTDTLAAQLQKYSAISYNECVDYSCKDYAAYGLDDPYGTVEIDYYTVTGVEEDNEEDKADTSSDAGAESLATPVPEEMREYYKYILYVGDSYTEGDAEMYYVRPDGTDKVYTVSADTVEGMFNFTAYSMADQCIYSELVDQLSGYDIEYKGKKYVVERKEEPKEASDTDSESGDTDSEAESDDGMVNVYYVNGRKVDETELLTLYSAAYLLTLSGEADESLITDEEAVLTITYHPNDGEDVVVKYIPYGNENFYSVDKNGMSYFLTDKRGIDDLISRYESFMADNDL